MFFLFKRLSRLKKLFLLLIASILFIYLILSLLPFQATPPTPNSPSFSPHESLLNCSLSPAHNSSLIWCDSALEVTREPLIGPKWRQCSSERLLAVVFNRVHDFKRRQTIRETWKRPLEANSVLKAKVVFAVAQSRDIRVEERLREESRVFGDILQFSFFESYFNCSLKVVSIARFAAIKCPKVRFVLKVDDDVIVDTRVLEHVFERKDRKSFHGFVWSSPKVQRDSAAKWTIGERDYPFDYYPDYIGGPYLIPGLFTQSLYQRALQSIPWLPFEDVFFTGILAKSLRIKRENMKEILFSQQLDDNCDLSRLDLCFYSSYALWWQNFSDKDLFALNSSLSRFEPKNCKFNLKHVFSTLKRFILGRACAQQ